MPYNLRKRKVVPEPVETVQPVAKKPVAKRKARVVENESSVVTTKKPRKAVKSEKLVESKGQKIEESSDKEVNSTEKVVEAEPTAEVAKAEVPPVSTEGGGHEDHPVEAVKATKKKTVKQVKIHAHEQPTETTNLLMFGEDGCGELGLKKIGFTRKTPTPVHLNLKIKQVACGPQHTVALTTTGEVYTFGCNDEGALGRVTEDEEEDATPTKVQLGQKIVKVTTGDSHSAALSEDKKVFIWGNFRDGNGPVGLLPECNGEKSFAPVKVMPERDFKDIASGQDHMLLLDTEGVVYSFGVGAQGQLGRLKPEDLGEDELRPFHITAENREVFLKPKPVDLRNVDPQRPFICDAVYAGNYCSFATNTDKKKNRLAAWGLNNYYQLGYKGTQGKTVQPFPKRSTFTCSTSMINVACGQHHTIFLTKTGRVYAAGKTLYGLLGMGNIKSETVCPAKKVETLDNTVVNIAVGNNVSFAITDEGRLYSWGMASSGLGSDEDKDRLYPTEVEKLKDKKVRSVASGGPFTAVLVE